MKSKCIIAIFGFTFICSLPYILQADDKDRWKGVFVSPKDLVITDKNHPQANRRGEIINDEDFIRESISRVFGSEKEFRESWYRTEALAEYYFALSPLVDAALAPIILELRDSLAEMEAARLHFQEATSVWEKGKPYSDVEIIEPLSQLREAASLLAVAAQRRIRTLERFQSLSIPIENVQSWYDRIDKEEREQLLEEEVAAYDRVLKLNERYLPHWRENGRQSSLQAIIPVLFFYSIEIQNWLKKVDQVQFVLANWFMDKVDELRNTFEAEHEWLIRIMPIHDLNELDEKLDLDLKKHLDEPLPETEPNYYFDSNNFKKEMALAQEAAQAPAWVSTLLRKISDQANIALREELQDLRNSLPFSDPDLELMGPQEAQNRGRQLRDLWWFRNLPYRLNFLSIKDLQKAEAAGAKIDSKAADLKRDYERTFLDPHSNYQRELKLRIEEEVRIYERSLARQEQRNRAEVELIAAESILREEVRQRRYNRAWAVLLWMRQQLAWLQAQGVFANAVSLSEHLDQYESLILESNTRGEWMFLLNEVAEAVNILRSSSNIQRQQMALNVLEALQRENLWQKVDDVSFRMELETQHHNLQAALTEEARERLQGGRK